MSIDTNFPRRPIHDKQHCDKLSVVCRLSDGLGNQLFQYAAGRSLADRLNADLLLDCGWFSENGGRVFALDDFSIDAVRDHNKREMPRDKSWLSKLFGWRVLQALRQKIPHEINIIDSAQITLEFREKIPI
ncbi:MAG: hypothetical protein HOP04_12805 [Methylophilaceae bacterium]|nr:hypothetical protein [Methylophilaceae bacterium]